MMSISRASAVIVCLFSCLAGVACAQQPSDTHPQAFPKVTIAGSELRTMKSTSTGRDDGSEEHTSELQSLRQLVGRLLLAKKLLEDATYLFDMARSPTAFSLSRSAEQ